MVDIASAALYLFAATSHFVNHLRVIGKVGCVVLLQPATDPLQLQFDDFAHHLIRDRIIWHDNHAAEQCGLEYFDQLRTDGFD